MSCDRSNFYVNSYFLEYDRKNRKSRENRKFVHITRIKFVRILSYIISHIKISYMRNNSQSASRISITIGLQL